MGKSNARAQIGSTAKPGMGNAHVKRMARKARNVKANRANHK
jgi:hypothetical protein